VKHLLIRGGGEAITIEHQRLLDEVFILDLALKGIDYNDGPSHGALKPKLKWKQQTADAFWKIWKEKYRQEKFTNGLTSSKPDNAANSGLEKTVP
jgi:hypothetical protein